MATFTKFHSFVEHLAEKVHNLGADTLKLAFVAAANAPSASAHSVLGDLTVASAANLDSVTLTTTSSSQTSGTYKLVIADKTVTSTGGTTGPFRYVVIYNDTPTSPADPLIGYYDYGSDITLALNETFTVDFDGTNGLLQIA